MEFGKRNYSNIPMPLPKGQKIGEIHQSMSIREIADLTGRRVAENIKNQFLQMEANSK
jgi:hypothetical protein